MQPITKIMLVIVFAGIFIFTVTAISLNPLLINQSKTKTYLVDKLNYTDTGLSSGNFTIIKIEVFDNLTKITLTQDGVKKKLIISNERALEKLT